MKWIRRVAIACAVLILVIAIVVLFERLRGQVALSLWKKEMVAKGEKLNVLQLIPNPPSPADNAAPALFAVGKELMRVPTNIPPTFKFLNAQQVIAVRFLEEWQDKDAGGSSARRVKWSDVESCLVWAQPQLNKIFEALEKPAFNSGAIYTNDFTALEVPGLAQIKMESFWLSTACLAALHKREAQPAFDALRALNSLTASQQSERLVISQLVRITIAQRAFGTLWQSLEADIFTDTQLSSLSQQWQNNHFVAAMNDSFEVERDMSIDQFKRLRGSKSQLDKAVQEIETVAKMLGAEDSFDAGSFFVKNIQIPLWQFAYSYHEEVYSLRKWQDRIQELRFLQTNSWAALNQVPSGAESYTSTLLFGGSNEFGWYDKLRYLFLANSMFNARAVLAKAVRTDTEKEMALAAIALARYRKATEKYPQNLSELVPAYLPEVPKDFMDGKALRYRLNPDGSFLLYSVGEDGIDDGGDASSEGKKPEKITVWDGKDAVWPEAVRIKQLTTAKPKGK